MIPPSPDRPKDFTIVKRQGLYHLFYIRNNPNLPEAQTQVDFGHATSKDLYFWTPKDPVLVGESGTFDASHKWAPSIVERDGIYYMFYTGVSDSQGVYTSYQRIGLATSTDLNTWNTMDVPIFSCEQVPWAACDSTNSSPFRDPFVMEDPTTPGRWLMYYSTAPSQDPGGMIVGVASSDGDFTQWQDLVPLWITQRSFTFNDVVESPHVFDHDGLWYLFYTTSSGQPISFATSANPIGQPGDWTYRGRLGTMIGVNTAGWFASEHFRDGIVDYLLFVDGDRVEVSRIVWQTGWSFLLAQPDLFHVQSMGWMNGGGRVGQSVSLGINSSWWSGHTADLQSFWVDDSDVWHQVPNSMLGIPDHVPLTADFTTYPWVIRALPDSMGIEYPQRIAVRLVDQTAASQPFQVSPARGGIGVDPPDPPIDEDPGGGNGSGSEELQPKDGQPILRNPSFSMFGGQVELLVDMPSSQPARLDVFDLQGRRLRTLADRTLPKGANVLLWDRRDANGRAVARGIYFARLTTPQATRTTRVLVR